MKATKIMAIIGIIISVIATLVVIDTADASGQLAWGEIAAIYLLALSIVGLIQVSKQLNLNK
jgi:hypothetical protein